MKVFDGQDETFHLVIGDISFILKALCFYNYLRVYALLQEADILFLSKRGLASENGVTNLICFSICFYLKRTVCLLKKFMTGYVVSFDLFQPNQTIGLSGAQPFPPPASHLPACHPKCSFCTTFYSANVWLDV